MWQVSPELIEASMNVDLVILEGMGRSIETNLNADLKCDTLNLGMIKHPEVRALLAWQTSGISLRSHMYSVAANPIHVHAGCSNAQCKTI